MWHKEIQQVITPEDVGKVITGLPLRVRAQDIGKHVYREWSDDKRDTRVLVTIENDDQLAARREKIKDRKTVPPQMLNATLASTDELIAVLHKKIELLKTLKKSLMYHCISEEQSAGNS